MPEEPDEQARARIVEGFQTDVEIRDKFTLRADEVEKVGGSDTGPMPSELLLASLASCMCMAMNFAANKRDVSLPELEVEVQGFRDPKMFRFGSIRIVVHSPIDEELLSELLEKGKGYCYVSNTLEGDCELSYTSRSTSTPTKDDYDRNG